MANQYLILNIIKVDSGLIPNGTYKNGQPVMGQHIPYYAGLVIQNQKSLNLEFLDDYNSEILLRNFFGYQYINPSLGQIISENREFLESRLSTIVTPDLDSFLKQNKIMRAPRNSSRMIMMAERMK